MSPPREDTVYNIDVNKNSENQMESKTEMQKESTVPPQTALQIQTNADDCPKDNKKDISHDYEDVLHLIGFGKTQIVVLLTCGLLLMTVINETMGMSILTITSQCDFNMTSVDKAVMSAASFIGILLSSYFWGYLSDTLGRRVVLLYSTYTSSIFSFISMFIPNYWAFVVARLFVGIFIAGASSTTYAYLGEFVTMRYRSIAINYASTFVGISLTYVPAVAWLVLSMQWSLTISDSFEFRPWRLLILLNLLPGVIATTVLVSLPESPKLLISLGKDNKAYEVVDWICKRNTRRNLTDLGVYKLKSDTRRVQENLLTTSKSCLTTLKKMWIDTVPLYKPPYVLNFLISCTVMCGLFVSSSGMGLWYTEIQNRLGSNTDENLLTVCQVIYSSVREKAENALNNTQICDDSINTKSFIDSIIYGCTFIVGFIIMGFIIKPLGRKTLIIGALFISGLCGIALLWILQPIAIVVSFCLFLILPGLCVSVLSGAVVDLVPTHLRGKAVCICLMLGRAGSVLGGNIIGSLLESQCIFTFGLFSGCVIVCGALTFILPI